MQILSRGRVAFFRQGTTILRENSYGSAFYVLLEGHVVASSTRRRIDAALNPGSCFGEVALVATSVRMRREASVTALDDAWCLRLSGSDVTSMRNVDLGALSQIYFAKLLSDVRWFNLITPKKLQEVAQLMQIENFSPSRHAPPRGPPHAPPRAATRATSRAATRTAPCAAPHGGLVPWNTAHS